MQTSKNFRKKYAKLFASLENSFVYLQSVFAPLQTRNRSKILNRKRYAIINIEDVKSYDLSLNQDTSHNLNIGYIFSVCGSRLRYERNTINSF